MIVLGHFHAWHVMLERYGCPLPCLIYHSGNDSICHQNENTTVLNGCVVSETFNSPILATNSESGNLFPQPLSTLEFSTNPAIARRFGYLFTYSSSSRKVTKHLGSETMAEWISILFGGCQDNIRCSTSPNFHKIWTKSDWDISL